MRHTLVLYLISILLQDSLVGCTLPYPLILERSLVEED